MMLALITYSKGAPFYNAFTSTTRLSPAILREAMTESSANRKSKARRAKGLCTGCGKSPCVCKSTQAVRAGNDLQRVEAAIHQKDKAELQWADEYCRKRARASWDPKRRDRSEYWIRLRARVANALLKASGS